MAEPILPDAAASSSARLLRIAVVAEVAWLLFLIWLAVRGD